MAQFVVRNLDDDLKARLKRRARLNGVSMEEEVRRILQRAVVGEPPGSAALGSRMAARFFRDRSRRAVARAAWPGSERDGFGVLILLDTNVLSELMQRQPEPTVIAWLDAQAADSLWLTSVTLFEAQFGIAALAAGRRKDSLLQSLESLVSEDLQYRIAAFDSSAAQHAARLAAERKRVAGLWICAIPLLPPLCWRTGLRLRPAIRAISKTCRSCLIHGQQGRGLRRVGWAFRFPFSAGKAATLLVVGREGLRLDGLRYGIKPVYLFRGCRVFVGASRAREGLVGVW